MALFERVVDVYSTLRSHYYFIDCFSYISDKHCSMLYCFIDSMNTLAVIIYRPPDAPTEYFKGTLNLVQKKLIALTSDNRTPDLYIMGEFNLPHIDWENSIVLAGQTQSDQRACSDRLDFMNKNFLSQIIHKPLNLLEIATLLT